VDLAGGDVGEHRDLARRGKESDDTDDEEGETRGGNRLDDAASAEAVDNITKSNGHVGLREAVGETADDTKQEQELFERRREAPQVKHGHHRDSLGLLFLTLGALAVVVLCDRDWASVHVGEFGVVVYTEQLRCQKKKK